MVRATGLEPARITHWNLNPTCLPIPPCPPFGTSIFTRRGSRGGAHSLIHILQILHGGVPEAEPALNPQGTAQRDRTLIRRKIPGRGLESSPRPLKIGERPGHLPFYQGFRAVSIPFSQKETEGELCVPPSVMGRSGPEIAGSAPLWGDQLRPGRGLPPLPRRRP